MKAYQVSPYKEAFAYAQKNGFNGAYEAYVDLQYQAYADICKRCDVEPLVYAVWFDKKAHCEL